MAMQIRPPHTPNPLTTDVRGRHEEDFSYTPLKWQMPEGMSVLLERIQTPAASFSRAFIHQDQLNLPQPLYEHLHAMTAAVHGLVDWVRAHPAHEADRSKTLSAHFATLDQFHSVHRNLTTTRRPGGFGIIANLHGRTPPPFSQAPPGVWLRTLSVPADPQRPQLECSSTSKMPL